MPGRKSRSPSLPTHTGRGAARMIWHWMAGMRARRRAAARRRAWLAEVQDVIEQARRPQVIDEPTRLLPLVRPATPLLTRGQAARTRRPR